MNALSRRQLLTLGVGATAATILAGCSTPGTTSVNTQPTLRPADGPITITYWSWLKDLQKVADVWNATHPDVQVEVSWIQGGNAGGYQKLYSALAAGSGPDLAQIEMRSLPEFMLVNGVTDLGRYGVEQYRDLYDETLWNQVSFTGGVYAIPQDSGPVGMYYRPDLFEAAGLEIPATREEWFAAGEVFRDQGSSLIDVFPISDTSGFAGYAGQAGATWFKADEDGWLIDMADEATLEVARFFDRAIDERIVGTSYNPYTPAWFAAAARDEVASLVSASWGDALMTGISGAEGKWRVAPAPVWSTGFGSTYQGGSTAAVLSTSRYPKEAMEFAVWMTTSQEGIDAMIQYSGIGWSPARDTIGTAREGGSDFFGGQRYNTEVFQPATEQQNPDWSWWPVTQQSFNILADGFRRKSSGGTLVDAVVQTEAQVIEVFRNKGLTIRKASR